jgi:hypothetical protein
MKKLVVFVTTTVGSAAGWWLGSDYGIMTAFILSVIGFGVGMYFGKRYAMSLDI